MNTTNSNFYFHYLTHLTLEKDTFSSHYIFPDDLSHYRHNNIPQLYSNKPPKNIFQEFLRTLKIFSCQQLSTLLLFDYICFLLCLFAKNLKKLQFLNVIIFLASSLVIKIFLIYNIRIYIVCCRGLTQLEGLVPVL